MYMATKGVIEQITEFVGDAKKYIETRYDLARLEATEKIVLLTSFYITFFSILLLIVIFILFLSLSLAFYLGSLWNDVALGFLTVSGIYFILGTLFVVLRKKLITQPILKYMLQLMFKEEYKHDRDE